MDKCFIDHAGIYDYLKNTTPPDTVELEEILAHARGLKGISLVSDAIEASSWSSWAPGMPASCCARAMMSS